MSFLLNKTQFLGFASCLLGGILAAAQPPTQTTQKSAAPPPQTEDCGCDEQLPPGPQVWAVVDGMKIFDTELKAALAQQVDPLLKQLQNLRKLGLEDLVTSRLIDKEAKALGTNRIDYLRIQIEDKLQMPSDAEVQAWIDKNKTTIQQDTNNADFRRAVALYLKDLNRVTNTRALGEQLRKKYTVNILPEVTPLNTDPVRVVAIVDGAPVRRADVDEFTKARAFDLKKQIFDIRKQVLDRQINTVLLGKEAVRRGIPVQQLLNKEVLDKVPLVTIEQADAFYKENRAQIQQPLEVVRSNIMAYLRQQSINKEEERLSAELRKKATIAISLPGVIEPTFVINTQGKPSKGPQNAPVTIVEFTDYECPRCGEIQPMLKDMLAAYPNKIRFVAREFPLSRHAFARKAAQAAQCAFEQGKFWEYTALLFKNQTALDEAHLLQYATQVGMDQNLLAAHLKSGIHDRAVQEDLDEGAQVGVSGTPFFYINGRRLDDRTLEGFKQAIDQVLAPRK